MKKRLSFLQTILLIGCVPLIAAIVILTAYSANKIEGELVDSTYLRLKACSTSVEQYFSWDIREGILEKDEVSYEFIDSLKEDHIEQTFFVGDTRFITSILDEQGDRVEGTQASSDIWDVIQTGQDYRSDGVYILGEEYYVYYMPVYSDDGEVIGMAFSGEKASIVNDAISSMLKNLFIISGFLLILFTIVLVVLAIKIRKPLMQTSEYINKIANGDLSEKLDCRSMVRETHTIIQSSVTLQDKLSSIVYNVDHHVDDLDRSIDSLNVLAESSRDGTNQIRTAVDELSTTSVTLAEDVQTVNGKVIEMGDHIAAIDTETVSLNQNAAKMDQANREASGSMDMVLSSSKTTSDIISEIITQVQETNTAISSINEAVDLISSITGQTNLLALNASIEAARAGQAGKGFAVVAEEIKQLASQSSQGADAIKNIANNILEKSNESVALTARIKELTEEEQGNISQTKQSFDVLSSIINDNINGVRVISDKAKRLEELKKHIIDSVSELSAISEENAASNEEVTASVANIAESINKISEDTQTIRKVSADLTELMTYFK